LRSESVFKWENHSFYEKTLSSYEMEKYWYLMERNYLCSRQECLAHCFPMIIELPFERNPPYPSGFSSVRNLTLCKIAAFK
jgi:hypothetical protein